MTGIKIRHNSIDSSHNRRFNVKTYIKNDVTFSGRNTVRNVSCSTCATMRVRLVYERRRCASKVKMSHAMATLNSNNFVVYGQKH